VLDQLERIYREHRQGLFSLALAITRRADCAEDAVHDAFARLFRSEIQPQRDVVSYVFAAVRNAAVDQLRRRVDRVHSPQSLFDAAGSDPVAEAIESERRALVRQAVEDLSDEQRETVVMRMYSGLKFQQIADVLGEPLPTITSRYRRALQRIKTAIEASV